MPEYVVMLTRWSVGQILPHTELRERQIAKRRHWCTKYRVRRHIGQVGPTRRNRFGGRGVSNQPYGLVNTQHPGQDRIAAVGNKSVIRRQQPPLFQLFKLQARPSSMASHGVIKPRQ